LYDLRLVESGGELVNAEDMIADTDVEVFVAFGRGVVIAVGGNHDPFAVVEGNERGDFFAGGGVPNFYRAVFGTGKHLLPVRAERYGRIPTCMPLEGSDFQPTCRIPQFYCSISGTKKDLFPVGTERYGIYRIYITRNGFDLTPVCCIPQY